MKFLVRLTTMLPPEMNDERRNALLAAEAERGRELVTDGTIEQLWRLPGRLANVGVWSVPDADALHVALTSLPLWRWMDVQVEALANHPLTSTPTPLVTDAQRDHGRTD
ncbi:muconolactone Delta-isomerase family protein [Actinoplanes bogorensis]|uniref:muconolactone Delta-isomerase n=1 Tax=Paractinoplanes bogorensis TaxID=1610840 RepID=A0ABS5Z2E6_9ACTN|nr:muconolactone Delta-isomerase family protein [Actinoplanes bogorensis]MBU2669865.1 muconolactone Delta-isomerase family protein [Actinoplanes bogorensis]